MKPEHVMAAHSLSKEPKKAKKPAKSGKLQRMEIHKVNSVDGGHAFHIIHHNGQNPGEYQEPEEHMAPDIEALHQHIHDHFGGELEGKEKGETPTTMAGGKGKADISG
jgi:hypothetical protein